MKITSTGVYFDGYVSASPSEHLCAFTDKDGATLLIDTAALVRMYELVRFDLERRGGWAGVMARIEDDAKRITFRQDSAPSWADPV